MYFRHLSFDLDSSKNRIRGEDIQVGTKKRLKMPFDLILPSFVWILFAVHHLSDTLNWIILSFTGTVLVIVTIVEAGKARRKLNSEMALLREYVRLDCVIFTGGAIVFALGAYRLGSSLLLFYMLFVSICDKQFHMNSIQ